ncbi:MAG: transposase [Patescibacteria group bacterium]
MDLYHVMNRGVDKRDIFLDEKDFLRFIHNLYEFNDAASANSNSGYWFNKNMDIVSPYIGQVKRERLVEIHGWALMNNHYHLLLSEAVEGGLTLFLRKLNVGYAKYFNERYERTGTLFQGRTKKVLIAQHAHFLYILHYVHLNPLDYFPGFEEWRQRSKGSIRNVKDAMKYLGEYRWSSYLDYCKIKNFPSILTTSLFRNKDVFENYSETVQSYLREIDVDELSGITLE